MIVICLMAMLQQGPNAVPLEVLTAAHRMPAPSVSAPTVATRFVRDTVAVGESVRLVTVVWMPLSVRDTMRHLPVLAQPTIVGHAVTSDVHAPRSMGVQNFSGTPFEAYVAWQTVTPSGGTRIEASPATLSYPTISTANLLPVDRRVTVQSLTAAVVVRSAPMRSQR